MSIKPIKELTKNIFLLVLAGVGFFLRIFGLGMNYSFWTDENHVALFAEAILARGKPVLENGYRTGAYQGLMYWVSAASAKLWGLNEFGIRFPSVVFGVLTIIAIYLLGKELFNKKTALLAAFFLTFLKIEILMSRQARPYQALQFFFLLSAYFVFKIIDNKDFKIKNLLGFLFSGILACLMHGLGLAALFSGLVFLLLVNFDQNKRWLLPSLLAFLGSCLIFQELVFSYFAQLGQVNNLFYYRVFLAHNYFLFCLLAFLGSFLLIWRRNYRDLFLFAVFLGVQIIIDSFFLKQPFIRYFYPVLPFIILLTSYGLVEIIELVTPVLFSSQGRRFVSFRGIWISLLSAAFILLTFSFRDKFVFWPQQTYSLNEDMQEIPEVDWKKIYGLVAEKKKENPDLVLITNWNDLSLWYLGEGNLNFLLRSEKKEIDALSGAIIINSLGKFEKLLDENRNGIIVLDSWDDRVPAGIREYVHQNLKREYELDRLYPVQPRYWTVWVYSWGLD
ncbi:MAG: glycosyltransferase family 39 protein [Candidatus Shapirobacteria bacterium]